MPRSEFRAVQPQVRQMITRFAPSPTGNLHLGHAYAAWFAWHAAREVGGTFLLRWEDIDGPRCRPEYETSALEDLDWLGIPPDDASMRQSERLPAYQAALDTLRHRGLLYPCFCTRRDIQDEIHRSDQAPQGPDGPIYPGTCRKLSAQEVEERIASGQSHAWRLKIDDSVAQTGPLSWHDREAGTQTARPEIFGDVVVARKDIPTSYHLAVTVDDATQQIDLVTRGKDLFESTHLHRVLQALLDLPVPEWHHHRLICDAAGKRLAKRDDATSLQTLRAQGVTPGKIGAQLGIPVAIAHPNDPLHGVTLKEIVQQLVDQLGWEDLGSRLSIRCFNENPSVSSSLKFLRKTPWAREKVEQLYLRQQRRRRS